MFTKIGQSDGTWMKRQGLATLVAATTALPIGCGAAADDERVVPAAAEDVAVVSQALTNQERMDNFYAIANTVTVKVTIPAAEWTALKNEAPLGGNCNWDETRDRFKWRTATSVEISGSSAPARTTFSNVGIKKKSFCGSFSTTKPAIKLDLAKFTSGNKATAEAAIGSQFLTLNNSIQDDSFVRQCLGYAIFKRAGLPNSRCNFTKLIVNGVDQGVYVNVEPIRERYIERNFNNTSGNLYEIEKDDLVAWRIPFIDVESLSKVENKKDLEVAAAEVAKGIAGLERVVDINQFIKIHALEILLKHWDGFTTNINNTYIYNDVAAVTNPTVANVKLKFIPWGLDQILEPDSKFEARTDSVPGTLVRGQRLSQLRSQVRAFGNTVVDRASIETVFLPLIDQMAAKLETLGARDQAEIDEVKNQLRLVPSAAFGFSGGFPAQSFSIMASNFKTVLHASATEPVESSTTDFLVFNEPLTTSRSDRWIGAYTGEIVGFTLTNDKFATKLHASATLKSPAGNLLIYTTPSGDVNAKKFWVEYVDSSADAYSVSGFFLMYSLRTGNYLKLSTTDLSDGRPLVHQTTKANATKVLLY